MLRRTGWLLASLAIGNPALASQLHLGKNKDEGVNTSELHERSPLPVWWHCGTCDHAWIERVSLRNSQQDLGCPSCRMDTSPSAAADSNDSSAGNGDSVGTATQHGNDGLLLRTHPEVAAEWNVSQNITVDLAAVKCTDEVVVWWKCGVCGDRYRASVLARTSAPSHSHYCPTCRQLPAPSGSTEERAPDPLEDQTQPLKAVSWLSKECLDPAAQQMPINSEYEAPWQCEKCFHCWRASIKMRALAAGKCPQCDKDVTHATIPVELQREVDPAYPKAANKIRIGVNRPIPWQCSACGQRFHATPRARMVGDGCPRCLWMEESVTNRMLRDGVCTRPNSRRAVNRNMKTIPAGRTAELQNFRDNRFVHPYDHKLRN